MRNKVLTLIAIALISLPAAPVVQAEDNHLVIQGSTTVLPIAQRCAESFMQDNPAVNISVRGGGSGTGVAALVDGICDIANASRPMKDKELKKAVEKGVDPVAHVVALDGIALIVNNSNPVDNLTLSQLQDIYTGKISNWSQLGGSNKKIVVISRDSASGTYETFYKIALKKKRIRPDALLQASNRAIVSTVNRTPGAIGYVGLGYLGQSVKDLTINGVEASTKTVLKGDYAISRPLFMYTDGKPKGLVKKFINFIASDEGQEIVSKEGFVALTN
jgi:phosphate transport system substrate-binding protein